MSISSTARTMRQHTSAHLRQQGQQATPEFIAGTFAAQPLPSISNEAEFRREDVPLKALRSPTPVRTGRVVFAANGFEIEPYNSRTPDAEPAYLFLVTDFQGQAQDIVAWAPDTDAWQHGFSKPGL